MPVRYSQMRSTVIDYLRDFADAEHVRRVWLDRRPRSEKDPVDSYDDAVVELYNGLVVVDDPFKSVGWVLASTAEAAALKAFFDAHDHFWERYPALPDLTQEMTMSAEWRAVQEAARGFIASLEPEG